MLNLLRMDLYRMRKGKAAYICLGIILATIALVYFLLFLMLTPTGQAAASRLGMMDFVEVEEAKALFREINLLLVFRQSNILLYLCVLILKMDLLKTLCPCM